MQNYIVKKGGGKYFNAHGTVAEQLSVISIKHNFYMKFLVKNDFFIKAYLATLLGTTFISQNCLCAKM